MRDPAMTVRSIPAKALALLWVAVLAGRVAVAGPDEEYVLKVQQSLAELDQDKILDLSSGLSKKTDAQLPRASRRSKEPRRSRTRTGGASEAAR